jgi:hypothetical protein
MSDRAARHRRGRRRFRAARTSSEPTSSAKIRRQPPLNKGRQEIFGIRQKPVRINAMQPRKGSI